MDTLLRIRQINLQKGKASSVELTQKKEEVFLISEPNSGKGKVFLLNDSSSVIFHANDVRPRAAIRTVKRLNAWLVDDFTKRDICTVCIKIGGVKSYLCSLYLDIELDVVNEDFVRLAAHAHANGIPLIVAMDSNAHSSLWGSRDQNPRGDKLESA